MTKTATLLTGPLGLGHEMMARCCAQLLGQSGWGVRRLDSMSLLGPWSGGAGMRMFNCLVAAADVVLALPGANTCAEARVVGRHLLLLDVMPGHGRDNLLHELELGRARACVATPGGVTASVLALRDEAIRPSATPAPRWEPACVAALRGIGLDLQPWKEPSPHAAHAVSQPTVL